MALTAEQGARIEAAVAAAEKRTSAEFAVVIAPSSDDYAGFPLVWAGAAALLAGGVAALVWPHVPAVDLFLGQGALFLILAIAFTLLPLRVRLAPPFVRAARTGAMADLQFAARVLNRTRDNAGLLLFVSLAEHAAEIRVDRRIAAVVPESAWDAVMGELLRGARAGKLTEAVMASIDRCAQILAPHFPPQPDQENELPDRATLL